MTEAEIAQAEADELELLELDAAAGQARAPAPKPKRQEMSGLASAGHAFAQSATMDFGDEIGGFIQAAGEKLLPSSLGGSDSDRGFWDTYRLNRDASRREDAQAQADNPNAYTAGSILGGVTTAALPIPGIGGVKAATGLKALVKTGAKLGALGGLGASTADATKGEFGDLAGDVATSAAVGGAFPLAMKGAGYVGGKVLGAGRKLYSGLVTPTAAARKLMDKGVDLTVGHMQPNSLVGGIEQSAQSIPGLGDAISGQRGKVLKQYDDLILNEVRAPGVPPLRKGMALQDAATELDDGFKAAYDTALGGKHYVNDSVPAVLEGKFLAAVDNPALRTTDVNRGGVRDFLKQELTTLKRDNTGQLGVDSLQQLRSNIRREIRETKVGMPTRDDRITIKMLQEAEGHVSDALNGALPKENAAYLKAIDKKYGGFTKVLDTIAGVADDGETFTPAQLGRNVRKGMNTREVAKGGGGELRKLVKAGRATLDVSKDRPPTGARMLMGAPGLRNASAAAVAALNTPQGKRFALGQTAPQQTAQAIEQYLQQTALAKALRSKAAGAVGRAGLLGGSLLSGAASSD